MGRMRSFILGFFSAERRAKIEAASRQWILHCPCGHERSIWDAGGIRYKAAGRPRRYLRCPGCGHRTWQTLSNRQPL